MNMLNLLKWLFENLEVIYFLVNIFCPVITIISMFLIAHLFGDKLSKENEKSINDIYKHLRLHELDNLITYQLVNISNLKIKLEQMLSYKVNNSFLHDDKDIDNVKNDIKEAEKILNDYNNEKDILKIEIYRIDKM